MRKRRSTRRGRLGLLASAVVAACAPTTSGWELHDAADVPASPPFPIGFSARIVTELQEDEPLASASVLFFVSVADFAGAPNADGVVTVTGEGMPTVTLLAGPGGEYTSVHPQIGFARSYTVSVSRPSDNLSLTLTSPQDFAIALSPNPMARGTSPTLTWTPANEADVEASVHVRSIRGYETFSRVIDDSGVFAAPFELAEAGEHPFTLVRRRVSRVQPPAPTRLAPSSVTLARTTWGVVR